MTTTTTPPAMATRAEAFRALEREEFDIVVIGGGITGTGIARDAVLRGLSVALVEKTDFASGTSSKSSKLVHGGLRYLEHGKLRLVFEGTNERALLMRVAPHLVRPLEFLVPCYKRDKPGLFVLDVGLWIYDALSKFSSPKLHRTVRAGRVAKLEPALKREELEGGILYYDCMTDDARLTVENVLDARALGATIVNYARAVRLLFEDGRCTGVEVRDETAGPDAAPVRVRGKVVINATGPWCDDIRKMSDDKPLLSTSKGVHLIVDSARLEVRHAVVMKEKKRVVFAIPWGDRTVIGTTDTFYDARPEAVACDADDARYLLELANRYFPDSKLTPDDILATWAGLRPLVKPEDDVASASDVSREHVIVERPGLVTIAGGKLTTYRRMAAEVVERAGAHLPGGAKALKPAATADRPLPGAASPVYEAGYAGVQQVQAELEKGGVVDAAVAKHLAHTYGVRATALVERVKADPALGARLDPETPYVMAQVDVAVDEEQALTVDDVLGRRVPLLLRARDQGLGAVDRVAARMGQKLGWSPSKIAAEADAYRAIVAVTRQFRKSV
jgi:glycerol-3-phosphate dehydrogenase